MTRATRLARSMGSKRSMRVMRHPTVNEEATQWQS